MINLANTCYLVVRSQDVLDSAALFSLVRAIVPLVVVPRRSIGATAADALSRRAHQSPLSIDRRTSGTDGDCDESKKVEYRQNKCAARMEHNV